MPCYSPIDAWFSRELNASGKRSVVFNPAASIGGLQSPGFTLPCGRCIGCRLEHSRQRAMRCHHEASLYNHNSYITLTYNDRHVPKDGSLDKSHFQNFMKRLRIALFRTPELFHSDNQRVRYFHCGEYGENTGRPHYHALLFGLDFKDKQLKREENGIRYYNSRTLTDLWGMGDLLHQELGAVTFESAAYVARYITKKITGPNADAYYEGRLPEYTTGSSRPGIGKDWYEKYRSDVFPHDSVVVRGKEMKPPKYYMQQLEKDDPELYKKIKSERKNIDSETYRNNSPERRVVREIIHLEKAKQLKRKL